MSLPLTVSCFSKIQIGFTFLVPADLGSPGNTHTRLMALCPGLPRLAGTRKVQPIWILLKQEDSEWQWNQLGRVQVCTSLQTDNHASTPPLSFLQVDALSATQPTMSEH